jgi:hypothetical protein
MHLLCFDGKKKTNTKNKKKKDLGSDGQLLLEVAHLAAHTLKLGASLQLLALKLRHSHFQLGRQLGAQVGLTYKKENRSDFFSNQS